MIDEVVDVGADLPAPAESYDREAERFTVNVILDRLRDVTLAHDQTERYYGKMVAAILLTTGDLTVSKETLAVAEDTPFEVSFEDGDMKLTLVED